MPRIGLSLSGPARAYPYVRVVEMAGGKPVLVETPPGYNPVFSSEDPGFVPWWEWAQKLMGSLDGLLLGGGGDMHPAWYGEENRFSEGIDLRRDTGEVALFRAAGERRLPVLGICRGVQVMNVAAGGTLIQDLSRDPSAEGSKVRVIHREAGESRFSVGHRVRIWPSSLLFRLYGMEEISVNSRHHQAVGRVAPGLRPVAWAEDGTIEALEADSSWFCLGVQWHPEDLAGEDPGSRALFRAFVEACA